MVKIRYIIYLLICVLNLTSCSSLKSKDSVKYYVTIKMLKQNSNATIFNGITDDLRFELLQLDSYEKCIKSFYSLTDYTPNVIVYDNVMERYLNKSNENLKKRNNKALDMYNVNLDGSYEILRKQTKDDYTVIIEITKIKGSFISFDKDYIELPEISIEINPYNIESIDKVILPIYFRVMK